ncbi:Hypothetical predicted protein, partial [Mytilus galloprovincialis]
DWIGNRKKKESGRKYEYKKAHYSRGISAYNCFVSEKNKDYQGMKEWAPAWQSLSTEEKLYYKEKASNQTQTTDHPKAAKQLFKKIVSQLFFGEKKTAAFFNARPKIMEELYSNHSFGTESTEQKFPFKDLRKKAQAHMNRLYSDAIGQQQVQFPYKKVADRVISIHGFPECLPIKNISHYGEKDLMEILQIKKLVVENQSHHQIDNDDSQVAANGIEPGSEELLYNLLVNPEVEENIYSLASPPVTHILPLQPVTHTVPSLPVTHAFKSPSVTQKLTSPPVTHTLTSPPVTHTQPNKTTVKKSLKKTAAKQTFTLKKNTSQTNTHTKKNTIIHTLTSPPVTHTLTSAPVTHTLTSAPVTHTLTITTSHTYTNHHHQSHIHSHHHQSHIHYHHHQSTYTHITTSHTCTHITTSHTYTHITTSHTYTHITTSHTYTTITTSHTYTNYHQSHIHYHHHQSHKTITTSHTYTHITTSHTYTHITTSHMYTHITKSHIHSHPPVTHTLTSPLVTHTLTSPPVTHALTSPPVTHTLTSPPVTHTSKRPRGTAANRTKATKKRKNNKEWGVKGIIATRTVRSSREYLVHWDGFSHDHDSWEPEYNLTPNLIGQFFSNKI